MADIRVLPETLSNQIAAGEVVARPASAVKELMENAVDAGADDIAVEVASGGKRRITVADNGCGMSRDNALLSLERYATSKIFTKADLFSIATMGFRGEALPSIASVCRFTLTTREREAATATKIDVAGGKILNVTDAGAPPGTLIEAANLFFNTPARKKFLKTDKTEMGHIWNTFSGIALGNPGIQFRLFRHKTLLKNFEIADGLYERSVKILGADAGGHLLEVDHTDDHIGVSGFVSAPAVTRATGRMLWLFVNNRLISDRALVSAICQGYSGRLMKGRYPLAVLFVSLPFENVDVNVHPSKLEVRFSDAARVCRGVTAAVEKALRQEQNRFLTPTSHAPVSHETEGAGPPFKDHFTPGEPWGAAAVEEPLFDLKAPPLQHTGGGGSEQATSADKPGKKYAVKGQVFATYIVAESYDGMVIVDQHAAHERVVFETLKKQSGVSGRQSQHLVAPEILELGYADASLLEEIVPDLAALGFIIAPFGEETFAVKAVPALIDTKAVCPLIIEILEKILEKKTATAPQSEWLDEVLTVAACHGSIRANQTLNTEEMEKLLSDLDACDNPLYCPHGRPTMLKWKGADMEKLFKRVL